MTLSRRLLISASVILFVFLGLTGFILDQAFIRSAEGSVRERLQGQIYALLAAADYEDQQQRLVINTPLPDPRLSSPQSGLYAFVYDANARLIWRSASAVTLKPVTIKMHDAAQWYFHKIQSDDGIEYFSSEFSALWENANGVTQPYQFQVLENQQLFKQQVKLFRHELWGWLVGVSLILLVTQGVILRWGLKPLRRVAADLDDVKAGDSEQLASDYPGEIKVLTTSINNFIHAERAQRDRYRNTLADLAHSLKTPLAVIKAGIGDRGNEAASVDLKEQIQRMKKIIDYQLQRASTRGRTTMGKHVPLALHVQRIVDSLNKVYQHKKLQCRLEIKSALQFPGEEGDLLELAGNLIENAFKWAQQQVYVSASLVDTGENKALSIQVEDDGEGIPEQQYEEVLKRGTRADQRIAGHGIGLSVVKEIVDVYGGSMTISRSQQLGGAKIELVIPM